MAPSLLKAVGAVAVTFAAQTSAAKSYKVSEVYNSTNFFDKFDFFSVSVYDETPILVLVTHLCS